MNPVLIFLRIFAAPFILRYPLAFGVVSILLDNLDWYTKNIFGIAPIGEYQQIDKSLDTFYLIFILLVCLRFKNILVKNILVILFVIRFIGFLLFEITGLRVFLFLFPNVFESLFFFYYIVQKIADREPKFSYFGISTIIFLFTLLKLPQEFTIHVSNQPLIIYFFGNRLNYEDSNIQIFAILLISFITGIYFKRKITKSTKR